MVELARLSELYRVVDDTRANPTAIGNNKEARAATFTTEDDSGFLRSAVSTESKLTVGPLTIPVGTFLNMAGRLAQGPRILGSLHRDGDQLILTAQRIGGGRSYSWRVDRLAPVAQSGDHGQHSLDEMVEELAYRMFTDLAERGSERWKAVRAFITGVRAYRRCLHTPKDRKPNLKQAERKFTEALAEDEHFDLVYYNLGLVYTELSDYESGHALSQYKEAAKAAFRKANAQNPKRWEAFYALGRVHHYSDKEHKSAIQLCERIISFEPDSDEDTAPDPKDLANAYNLKGLALKELAKELSLKELYLIIGLVLKGQAQGKQGFLESAIDSFKQAITESWRALYAAERREQTIYEAFEQAVAQSWRALCAAERRERSINEVEQSAVPQLRELASTCLGNLAVAYREAAEDTMGTEQKSSYLKAEALLRQASRLTRSEARLYHELGKVHFRQGKYNLAVQELDLAMQRLRLASQTNPAEATFWADLALASVARNDNESKESTKQACEKVLEVVDYSAEGSEEALETAAKAYEKIGLENRYKVRARHFATMVEIVAKTREVGQGAINGEANFPDLEARLEYYDDQGQKREWAQVSSALGRLYRAANKPEKARTHLHNALKKLEGEHPQEIVHLGLRDALKSLEARKKHDEARQKEEYGEALKKAEEYGEALKKAEGALGLDPFNPSRHEELGEAYSNLEALEDAQAAWEIALLWNPHDPIVCTKIGRSHYLLMQDCHDIDHRNAASRRAVEYLERALGLYGSDQILGKGEAHYFLGRLLLDSGECTKGISHFKAAYAIGFAPWITRLFLGEAYRRNNASNQCINQYRLLIEEVKKSIDGGASRNELVGEETGNPIARGEILARAHCGVAFEYAERGVKLEDALSHVEEARAKADELEDEAAKNRCQAECAGCEGWILYKQDRIDPAIERLEHAISLTADAESYLHLALAYERKMQKCKDEDQAWFLFTRTRTHCRHTQNIDMRKEYWQDVDELLVRLDKFEAGRNE